MCSLKNLQTVYTEPPSYIRKILKSSENIYLVYNKINKISINNDEHDTPEESNISLDLTGNPLPTDLTDDVSLVVLEEHTWLHEENNHYPVCLKTARAIINKFNRESLSKEDKYSHIYCVCDGADKNCTLVLGACQANEFLSRTEIYNKGCFYQKDSRISLESMKQEHLKNMFALNCQVNSLIVATYTVFGSNLRNYKISNISPYSACILYNISWSMYQYNIPEYVQSAEMTVQTIIGHKESEMHVFWMQFMLLQTYMKILMMQPSDLEKVILTDNPKNYMHISEEIYCLLEEMQGLRKTIYKKKLKDNLDVNNLRQEDIADRLWSILISCDNVGDLKSCFNVLFEELALKESIKPIIADENKSSIAAIINEISCGKLAVPTLSSTQALEFLIELGIEKLKNDYFCILNHFDCLNYKKLEDYWSEVSGEYIADIKSAPNNRLTKHGLEKVTTRRIRLTVQPTLSMMDVSGRLKKLNSLFKMHIACDFLIMGKKTKLSTQESFNALVESVNEYVLKVENNAIIPKNPSDCILQEIKVNLRSNDVKCLQGKDPVAWNVKLISTCGRSIATTIFHHSLKPLFPPSIYNKYDIPNNDMTDQIYYVTKLVNFTERL